MFKKVKENLRELGYNVIFCEPRSIKDNTGGMLTIFRSSEEAKDIFDKYIQYREDQEEKAYLRAYLKGDIVHKEKSFVLKDSYVGEFKRFLQHSVDLKQQSLDQNQDQQVPVKKQQPSVQPSIFSQDRNSKKDKEAEKLPLLEPKKTEKQSEKDGCFCCKIF